MRRRAQIRSRKALVAVVGIPKVDAAVVIRVGERRADVRHVQAELLARGGVRAAQLALHFGDGRAVLRRREGGAPRLIEVDLGVRLRALDLFEHAADAVEEARVLAVGAGALVLQDDIVEVVAGAKQLVHLPAAAVGGVCVAFEVPARPGDRIRFDREPEVLRDAVEQPRHAAAELDHAVAIGEAVADEQHFQFFIDLRLVAVLADVPPISAVVRGGEVLAVGDDVAAALVRLPEAVAGDDLLLAVGVHERGFGSKIDVAEHEDLHRLVGKVLARRGDRGGENDIVGADPGEGIRADVGDAAADGDRRDLLRAVLPGRVALFKIAHFAPPADAQLRPVFRLDQLRRHRRVRARGDVPPPAAAGGKPQGRESRRQDPQQAAHGEPARSSFHFVQPPSFSMIPPLYPPAAARVNGQSAGRVHFLEGIGKSSENATASALRLPARPRRPRTFCPAPPARARIAPTLAPARLLRRKPDARRVYHLFAKFISGRLARMVCK